MTMRGHGVRFVVAIAATGLTALTWSVRTASAQATFEFAAESDALVIQLSRDVGILDADPTPLLRVYGDGLVRIHFPVYMRRAGDYTLQLDPSELEDLVTLIVEDGLVDFSPEATRARMRGIDAARRAQAGGQPGPLTFRSDPETVTIEVRLRRYTPAVGAARSNVSSTIVWSDARFSAERYPDILTLQSLAEVETRLLALVDRDDATRVQD